MMSPWPVSSTLYISIIGDCWRRLILQTPSSLIVCFSPVVSRVRQVFQGIRRYSKNLQSKNSAAKLRHISAFHLGFGPALTMSGIVCVSNSFNSVNMPSLVRNPTMIFGTPSKNDCIQYFISFLWKFSISCGPRISPDVLSSTQFIGLPCSAGFESQTRYQSSC